MTKTKKRKAPSDHAKEFSLGYQKEGNDGNIWEIVENKNGVKRWKKLNFSKKFKIKTRKSKSKRNKIKKQKSFDFKLKNKNKNYIYELLNDYDENNINFLKKIIKDRTFDIQNILEKKDYQKIIKKIQTENVQKNIIIKLNKSLPKNIINYFNYLTDNNLVIKTAINNYINNQYNNFSIFSSDIYFILKNDYDVLKDTSARENISLEINKLLKETIIEKTRKSKSKHNKTQKKRKNKTIKIQDINYRQLCDDIFWGRKAKAIQKLYHKIGGMQFIIVFKDGTYKFIKPKTKKWKGNTYYDKIKEYDENDDVVAILRSAPSSDALTFFICYLLFKIPKKDLDKILNMKEKDLEKYLITNYKKYFKNEHIDSKKNYLFQYYEPTKKEQKKTLKRRENNKFINKNTNEILNNKIYSWWSKLSKGQIIIIFKDNTYKFCKSNKKTSNAKSKEITEKWKEYGENKDVIGIIWSNMSVDTIQQFVYYLLFKIPKKDLDKILNMKEKDLEKYLITNYKKYFFKYEMETKKDYMFKQYEPNAKQYENLLSNKDEVSITEKDFKKYKKGSKEYVLKNKQNEQYYLHLDKKSIQKGKKEIVDDFPKIEKKLQIVARQYDDYLLKEYKSKSGFNLKNILDKIYSVNVELLKNNDDVKNNIESVLNGNGIGSFYHKNGIIIVEPQFS